MTTEKLRDIGLLKAMGATPAQVRRIFLWEGFLIGGGGVGFGLLLGLLICFVIQRYSPVHLPADIYYISEVPVHVQFSDLLTVAGSGLFLTLLAAFYPAWRAARVNPVEAIHYG
jgi:lipoprotein-releasing system permease protein